MAFYNMLHWLLYNYRNNPKFSDRQVWVNKEDPDQIAQSDQGLHCLPFRLPLSDALLYSTLQPQCSKVYSNFSGVQIFTNFTV